MSNPFWLGSGGCPQVQVQADLVSLVPALAGWSEFVQSAPPLYYRRYTISGGWTLSITSTGNPTETDQGTGAGLSTLEWDPLSSTPPVIGIGDFDMKETVTNAGNVASSPSTTNFIIVGSVGSPPTIILSADPATASGLGVASIIDSSAGIGVTGSGFFMNVTPSATVLTLTMAAQGSGVRSVNSGLITITLSNPDTADDAVTRAIAVGGGASTAGPVGPIIADIFAAGVFSVYENRSVGALNLFCYQTCAAEFICSNLIPGVKYHPVVLLEQRDAVGDGSGDTSGYGGTWTSYGTLSLSDFRPTGTTHTITATALPVVAGKQIRIKSISLTSISG